MNWLLLSEIVIGLPVIIGSILSVLSFIAAQKIMHAPARVSPRQHVDVTHLKPCYGLDAGLEDNLRSFCSQRYAGSIQLILCVQRDDDPALPLLRSLAEEYPDCVTVVITPSVPVVNGKVQNMIGGLAHARHNHVIITDSDVRVTENYTRYMMAAFETDSTGYACSLYRIVNAHTLAEKLEALSFNADFMPQVLFASWSKIAPFCLGASMAFRKSDLDAVGGMTAMLPYLVEDYEIGKRIAALGKRAVLVPHVVDMRIELQRFSDWWQHQVYWDMNTKAANYMGFVASILTRAVPFALVLATMRGGDNLAMIILGTAVLIRSVCAQMVMSKLGNFDISYLWLLPFRDCLGLLTWFTALWRRDYVWRGIKFRLRPDGTIIPRKNVDAIALGLGKSA